MTQTTARLARIARVRGRQARIAEIRLARALADQAAVMTTSGRLAEFRRDCTLDPGLVAGVRLLSAGAFHERIDAMETALTRKAAALAAGRDAAQAIHRDAARHRLAADTMHARALAADAVATDLRAGTLPGRAPKGGRRGI